MKLRFSFWIIIISMGASSMAGAESDTALKREARRQTESIRQGSANWSVLTTKFFEIHHQSTAAPDSIACLELDDFVEETLARIDVSGGIADELIHQKLSYYFCDDATVERLTGYRTRGMADLSGRGVISSHFPHFHELAHLLVDITNQKKAMQTLPLMQEGIACLLGGRWGRAPDIILYTGWVHKNFGMGKLEDVMTRDEFFSFGGGPDVAYPIGAMFCEVVRREAGWAGVMELYAQLSGSVEFVSSLKSEDVLEAVAQVCAWPQGQASQKLGGAMEKAWAEYRRCGIEPVSSLPSEEPDRVIFPARGEVRIWNQDDGYILQIRADAYPVYLLSKAAGEGGSSSIFTENLVGEVYQGQRYGLRCSSDNIALYDFITNQLSATWVAGFTDETGACDGVDTGLVFKIFGPASKAVEFLMEDGCHLIN